jgi:hypothetical protein
MITRPIVFAGRRFASSRRFGETDRFGDLGFSLSGGDFEATIGSTPVDRMVRVPLSPNTDATSQWVQPYVTAGARKSVDGDPAGAGARSRSVATSEERAI